MSDDGDSPAALATSRSSSLPKRFVGPEILLHFLNAVPSRHGCAPPRPHSFGMASVSCRAAGTELLLIFAWDRDLTAAVRAIPGRRWSRQDGAWAVPDDPPTRRRLLEIFGRALSLPPRPDTPDPLGRLEEELALRAYSPRTRRLYTRHARRFLAALGDVSCLDDRAVRAFLGAEATRVSRAHYGQIVSAVRFLLRHILLRPDLISAAPGPGASAPSRPCSAWKRSASSSPSPTTRATEPCSCSSTPPACV